MPNIVWKFFETLLSDDLSKVQAASGFECAKNSLHFGLQTQFPPNLINLSRNRRVFFDYPSPFAVGFARPLVGRIQAHFAAESADGAGEVEVVDGRVFHQNGVAHGVHARGYCPYDFFPVAHVHIVIHHDNEFGVHKLAQVTLQNVKQ